MIIFFCWSFFSSFYEFFLLDFGHLICLNRLVDCALDPTSLILSIWIEFKKSLRCFLFWAIDLFSFVPDEQNQILSH